MFRNDLVSKRKTKSVRQLEPNRSIEFTVQNENVSKSYQLFKKAFEKDSCRQIRARFIRVSIYLPARLKNTYTTICMMERLNLKFPLVSQIVQLNQWLSKL